MLVPAHFRKFRNLSGGGCLLFSCSVGRVWLCDPMDCSPPAPLSMGFPRQEYWRELPFPTSGATAKWLGRTCQDQILGILAQLHSGDYQAGLMAYESPHDSADACIWRDLQRRMTLSATKSAECLENMTHFSQHFSMDLGVPALLRLWPSCPLSPEDLTRSITPSTTKRTAMFLVYLYILGFLSSICASCSCG